MASRMDNSMTPMTRMPALAFTGTSTRSPQFPTAGSGHFYRLSATSNCYYVVDGNIDAASLRVATTDDNYLQAGAIEYIQIPAGGWLSVIQQTAAGQLNMTGMR